jgi:hypothetical protein
MEKRYFLIYKINDYYNLGGGTDWFRFDNLEEMDKKVNELLIEWGKRFLIILAGELKQEFYYEAVTKITKLERKDLCL